MTRARRLQFAMVVACVGLLVSCATIGPSVPVLIRNERHQAVTIEITGRPSVSLDDCTEMVVELPVTGDWSISADGRVAYRSAELRASGVADADNRYPVVMLQGGVEPVMVLRETGIPDAQVNEACRQGT